MNHTSKQLLLDVLKLRTIYSDRDFLDVITVLMNKNYDKDLSEILCMVKDLSDLSRSATGTNHKRKTRTRVSAEELLDQIEGSDTEKRTKITRIFDLVQSKEMFANVGEFREYLSKHYDSTKIGVKKTKQDLLAFYVSSLIEKSNESLDSDLKELLEEKDKRTSDSSFLRMANRITNG